VAADALTARGRVVLVGLTQPLGTRLTVDGGPPTGTGLAVLEQTVSLAGADSSIRDTEGKWLAGAAGDQKGGFTAAYDLLVPNAGVPLQLVYNPQWAASIEVYDWATGEFVAVAGRTAADPTMSTAALSPDEVRDGLVRVRLHEPRLSWGTTVWVDAVKNG